MLKQLLTKLAFAKINVIKDKVCYVIYLRGLIYVCFNLGTVRKIGSKDIFTLKNVLKIVSQKKLLGVVKKKAKLESVQVNKKIPTSSYFQLSSL